MLANGDEIEDLLEDYPSMNHPAAELRGIKRNFHLTPMQSIEEFF